MTPEEVRSEFNHRIRNVYITEHPYCVYCGAAAQHVHHLIPIIKGGDNRESNLIPLCSKCHGLIEGLDYDAWKEKQKIGIERAKKEGKYTGGKSKPKPPKKEFEKYYNDYLTSKYTKASLAKQLQISRPTLDKWINDYLKNDYYPI